jgi:trypsin
LNRLFYPGELCKAETLSTIIGWGVTDDQLYSAQLRSAQVPIVDKNKCNELYKHTDIGDIGDGRLCAGYVETGGKDTCQGDSGGPLIIDNRQAGIVSMGYECGLAQYPGVYAEVSFYNKWIMEQISL